MVLGVKVKMPSKRLLSIVGITLHRDRRPRWRRGHGFDRECAEGEERVQASAFHGSRIGDTNGRGTVVFAAARADQSIGRADGAVEIVGCNPVGECGILWGKYIERREC